MRFAKFARLMAVLFVVGIAGSVSAVAQTDLSEKAAKVLPKSLLVVERRGIEATHVYTVNTEGYGPGGGLHVFNTQTGAKRTLVDSSKGMIMNADLSFDAKRVLFAWKQNDQDSFHLYTVNIDGTGLKQITSGPFIDYDACWLPDGGIMFVSTRSGIYPFCWKNIVGNLYRMNADGSGIKRISYGMLHDFTPQVLDDGQIIFTRWEYIDKCAIPIQSLWTINPDGTGLQGYFGNRVRNPGTFMEARQVSGTNKIICTMAGHNGPCRGAIGMIDVHEGGNSQEAITNLTLDNPIGRVDEGDGNGAGPRIYATPYPLKDGYFLCSRLGELQLRNSSGSFVMPLFKEHQGVGLWCAQPVRPRKVPPVRPTSLPKDTDKQNWATVVMQDIYIGLEPDVASGDIAEIAVVEEGAKPIRSTGDHQLNATGVLSWRGPVISCGAAYAHKTVWGFAKVEKDGSAAIKVPARKGIYFLALDKQGRTIQRMRTFTFLQGGEVQGCVGCHADRNYATPNNGQNLIATTKTAQTLKKPSWGVAPFNYVKQIQPILDKNCVSCHNPRSYKAEIDLTGDNTDIFNVSYEYLARDRDGRGTNPYVAWIPTLNGNEYQIREVAPRRWGSPKSKLADLVLAGHLDGNGKSRVKLSDQEKRNILLWIDLNVPYYDTMEAVYIEKPGMRLIDWPGELKDAVNDVVTRRGITLPKRNWTRITNPENSDVLCGNLAKSAGGRAPDETAVFKGKDDVDYQKIVQAWQPLLKMLKERPRDDMPGAKPSPEACKTTY